MQSSSSAIHDSVPGALIEMRCSTPTVRSILGSIKEWQRFFCVSHLTLLSHFFPDKLQSTIAATVVGNTKKKIVLKPPLVLPSLAFSKKIKLRIYLKGFKFYLIFFPLKNLHPSRAKTALNLLNLKVLNHHELIIKKSFDLFYILKQLIKMIQISIRFILILCKLHEIMFSMKMLDNIALQLATSVRCKSPNKNCPPAPDPGGPRGSPG